MNWDAIGAMAELLGALGVIATLGYLAIQVRQSNRQESVNSIQQAFKDFINAYAVLTADESHAEIFRKGLNEFDSLPANIQAVFHSKMQIISGGFYQVWVMHENKLIEEDELYKKSEELFLAILLAPGGGQWWKSFKQMTPSPFATYVDRIIEESRDSIEPANVALKWYRSI